MGIQGKIAHALLVIALCRVPATADPRVSSPAGDLVHRYFREMVISEKPGAAAGILAPDCVGHGAARGRGRLEAETFAREIRGRFPIGRLLKDAEVLDILVDRSYAAAVLAAGPLLSLWVFRIENGLVAEYWTDLGKRPEGGEAPKGMPRSGTRAIAPGRAGSGDPATGRALVSSLMPSRDALSSGKPDPLASNFMTHDPATGLRLRGVAAWEAYSRSPGKAGPPRGVEVIVAERDLVMALSSSGGDSPSIDLFRVEGGRIVEHWPALCFSEAME